MGNKRNNEIEKQKNSENSNEIDIWMRRRRGSGYRETDHQHHSYFSINYHFLPFHFIPYFLFKTTRFPYLRNAQ